MSAYPNQTMEILLERASCRSFQDREIAPDVLEWVLKAGIHAPTGGNFQPYSIIKITNPETRAKMAELCFKQGFIADAPVSLLFCLDFYRLARWARLELAPFTANKSFRHFWIGFQDTVICAQNICTAADAMGLGSVYIGSIIEFFPYIRENFALPKGVFPVILLSLGYPAEEPKPAPKLGLDVIIHEEKYRDYEDDFLQKAFRAKYDHPGDEVTDENLRTIEEVCIKVHGHEFARKCLFKIQEDNAINQAAKYFGLQYRASSMPLDNEHFVQIMFDAGLECFSQFTLLADDE